MLFGHVPGLTADKSFDLSLLPLYQVSNVAEDESEFTTLTAKVAHPVCAHFTGAGNSVVSDFNDDSTVTVELKSGRRLVRVDKKPKDKDSVTQKDLSAREKNLRFIRECKETTQSFLQRLAAQPAANALEEIPDLQQEKLTATSLTGDVIGADNVVKCNPLSAIAATSHHVKERKKKKKRSVMEETWDLLDRRLYQKSKSQSGNCDDTAAVTSVHSDGKTVQSQVARAIPLIMEQGAVQMDPRPSRLRTNDTKEFDLPLVSFTFDRPLLADSADQQNWPAAESCETVPDSEIQRPIEVVIGVGQVAADAVHRDGSTSLIQSVQRSVGLLSVLDDSELDEFSHELNEFQQKIAAVISKHHSTLL